MPGAPGEKVCKMSSGFIIGCVYGQIYKKCPKDSLVADADCSSLNGRNFYNYRMQNDFMSLFFKATSTSAVFLSHSKCKFDLCFTCV